MQCRYAEGTHPTLPKREIEQGLPDSDELGAVDSVLKLRNLSERQVTGLDSSQLRAVVGALFWIGYHTDSSVLVAKVVRFAGYVEAPKRARV